MADFDVESELRVRSYLASHGGSVADAGGRGLTDEMARAIGVDKPATLSAILGQMERDGVITREMRGLRTFRIALTASDEPALVAAEAAPAVADHGGGRPDQSPASAVSLRDALKRTGAPPAPPVPPAAPESPSGAPGRAMSLREALAAKSETDVPQAGYTPTRQMAAPSTPPGPQAPAPTFNRFREPAVLPPLNDEPGAKSRTGNKADRADGADKPRKAKPSRADKSAKKAERRRRLRRQLSVPVPEVRVAPTATIVTAVGVAVAGLVLVAVISVVVSRGSTPHVVSNDTVSSATDACAVVSPEMASAVFGQAAGQPHFVLDSCVYDDGTHELIISVYRTNGPALFDAGRSSVAQAIPGLGDGAYYVDGRLRVLRGNSLILVALGPVPSNTPDPKLLAMASAAVGRL